MRRADVAAGNDVYAARGQRRFRAVAGQGGPFQHDFGARVDQLRAEGKSVDRRGRAVDGIIRDVADFIRFRKRRGNRAQNELGFVYAQIVAADVVVAGEHGAVEDFGARMSGALAHAGLQKYGGSGKNHVVSVGDKLLDDAFLCL